MHGVAMAVGAAAAVVGVIAISAALRSGSADAEDEVAEARLEAAPAVGSAEPIPPGPAITEPEPEAETDGSSRSGRPEPAIDIPHALAIDPELDAQLETQLRRDERRDEAMRKLFASDVEPSEDELARMRAFQRYAEASRVDQMRTFMGYAWGGQLPLTDEELLAYDEVARQRSDEARREIMQEFLQREGVGSFAELSPEQRRELGSMQRVAAQHTQRDFINRFDSSGDGRLSDADRERAATEIRRRIGVMQSLRLIDLNNDGKISPAEIRHYLVRFSRADPTADLNGDGVVDARDLQILSELISTD
ncbi:MAG: hypothetical protein JJU33_12890 [Phycisphaerales bacterium]|nr:hypothetical protein [Phycisphaerales bacterium]